MLETDLLSLIGPQREKAEKHFMSIPFFFYYKPKRKAREVFFYYKPKRKAREAC
jgi:hypothetical protein